MRDYVNKTLVCTIKNTEVIRHDRPCTNTKVPKALQYDLEILKPPKYHNGQVSRHIVQTDWGDGQKEKCYWRQDKNEE